MKFTLAALLLTATATQGATLTINMTNTSFAGANPFRDTDGVTNLELGDLVVLGYFSDGSLNFDNFVPIETVTFQVGASGEFQAEPTIDDTVDMPGAPPASSYRFGMRIFNAATEAAATAFNTVTDDSWVFSFWNGEGVPPQTSQMSLAPFFGAASPTWQDAAGAFNTSIPVTPIPEPSTSLVALLGLGFLAGKRRRN